MNYIDLPKDEDSERAILSIILADPEKLIEVVDSLQIIDFYSLTHQQIWQAIVELFKDGQDLDIVLVSAQLKKNEIDTTLASSALAEIFESQVKDTNLLRFVKQVKNKSLLRQIIKSMSVHTYNAQLEEAEAINVLENIEKDILKITSFSEGERASNAEDIIQEVKVDIQRGLEAGWQGYETGFIKLDGSTGGFIPTQSWIVGAYTGMGKSFLILQMILNVLRQGGKVALFSTEMDRKINMLRLIGNIAGLGIINIMRGNLLENEQIEVESAEKELAAYKDSLTIYDNVYTLAEIRLKAKKIKMITGLNLIAVDFIQNLRGKESIYERMSEAAIGLQQLAQELNVTMLIGSQVSQAAAGWQSKEAIEFKGAGEIAAIADVALWITRDENAFVIVNGKKEDSGRRTILLRKVRHGSPGQANVKMEFPSGRIREIVDYGQVK